MTAEMVVLDRMTPEQQLELIQLLKEQYTFSFLIVTELVKRPLMRFLNKDEKR